MPAPYSDDLRERVVAAYLRGDGTYEEIAESHDLGVATVNRWVSRYRRTGTVSADRMGGRRPPIVDQAGGKHLMQWLRKNPDLTIDELIERYWEQRQVKVSQGSMSRALARLGLTRKKRLSTLQSATRHA